MSTHAKATRRVLADGRCVVTFDQTDVVPALLGVVGSRAYGLDHSLSDLDLAGIYVADPVEFLGLNAPRTHFDSCGDDEDIKIYELGRAVELAVSSNPSMLELLFLDDYIVLDEDGAKLVDQRQLFLGAKGVRAAYGGYVMAQANALLRRKDSFSSATKGRTSKHARHCLRLLDQERQLLATGQLRVRVEDPQMLLSQAELALSDPEIFFDHVSRSVRELDETATVLPESVDLEAVNKLLVSLRLAHLR
jgi:hypothetical protein